MASFAARMREVDQQTPRHAEILKSFARRSITIVTKVDAKRSSAWFCRKNRGHVSVG
jgi:hypothetical protein